MVDAVRNLTGKCDAKNPESLRATKLRKHVATASQILDLAENEVQLLDRYMGHDIRVHRDYYRLPTHVQNLAHMSKIFTLLDRGTLQKSKSKKLHELKVRLDEFEESETSDEEETRDKEEIPTSSGKKRKLN